MADIEYFLYPLSPYAYLAGDGLETLAARHGARVVYRPVQLMRIFAEVGTPPLKDRHPSRRQYRLRDIARVAEAAGLPLKSEPMYLAANPVPASAAIISAQKAADGGAGGDVGALVRGFLGAVWAEGRDIADDEVVRDVLGAAGFDPGLADRGMLSAVETLERTTEEAIRRGVFGVPSYMVGDELFWGQDRLPHLDRHLAGLSDG